MMLRGSLLLVPVLAALGCQGTTVVVLSSAPADGGSPAPSCDPHGGDGAEGGTVSKGPHGGTWPTYAHDAQRTSHAGGPGAVTKPEIAWTARMGGVLQLGQAFVADVDGDGQPNAVTIAGGRATATKPDGSTG